MGLWSGQWRELRRTVWHTNRWGAGATSGGGSGCSSK